MTDNPQSSARRDFLRKGTALGIGLSAASSAISAAASQEAGQMQQGSGVLNEASKRLLERFGLKYPIFQAAPGGAKLAVAVANSGGMGAVGLT